MSVRYGVKVRIVVRSDSPPDDTTVLLHFGDGSPRAIRRIADEVVDRPEYWFGVIDARGRLAVSVYALDGISEGEIARAMPHASYGRSTAGEVRGAGFGVSGSTIEFDRMPPAIRTVQP